MNDNLNEVIDQINKAFFRLESYMNGTIDNYQYFDFNLAFTKLFTMVKMSENFTYENCKLIGEYSQLLGRLSYDIDQGNFDIEDNVEDDDFNKVYNEIDSLAWDRVEEFCQFQTPDEITKEEAELSFSITDIINKNISKPPKQQKRTTYQWQGNSDKELPELYSLMINEYKLIASDTTLEEFTFIFTGQPIKNIKPIKWLNSNRLLAYFLDCAFSGQAWQSIAGNGKLFHNKTKCLTANDLSVAKKGYVDYGQPKDYEKIDLILKTIKKD
jgi:hypothetical protein